MGELVDLWRRLDDTVDWISIWDHLYEAPPAGGTTPHFEAVATLGALAAITSKARLGCLMFCVPFRNPALLAKSIVAIDHLSSGRFEPGFGAGWHEPEFRAHGYEFHEVGTRFDQLTEGLEIIDEGRRVVRSACDDRMSKVSPPVHLGFTLTRLELRSVLR